VKPPQQKALGDLRVKPLGARFWASIAVWMEAAFFKEEIWLTAQLFCRFRGNESLDMAQDPMIFCVFVFLFLRKEEKFQTMVCTHPKGECSVCAEWGKRHFLLRSTATSFVDPSPCRSVVLEAWAYIPHTSEDLNIHHNKDQLGKALCHNTVHSVWLTCRKISLSTFQYL